jgi:hypothetical protein
LPTRSASHSVSVRSLAFVSEVWLIIRVAG